MAPPVRIGRPVNADAERTRRNILMAAMTHVAEVGYAKATMKSIAEHAGLTSSALYRYYPSKSELVIAALNDVIVEVMARLEKAAFAHDSLRDRLIGLLEEALECTRDHPSMTRFEASLFLESSHTPEFAPVIGFRRRAEETLYRRLVDDALRRGELPADTSPVAAVDMVTSITWGLTYLSATATAERHRAAIRITESLLAGTLLS
ncbi:MAG TPA: TetR/AcrR family transcriptional regulator [Amycolatopsis sp.]|nr:TetR/AcrR family transcriptional regulator [Amycolatopsis sp.]